jgi:alpha-amylase/alpha-mannosidase (GH57 family)
LSPERHLIIHGHFYQPPRENPWTGMMPDQPSAAPYPNWNARINRECYAPNTLARVLDGKAAIDRVINNFRHMSFNTGPTLMSWMENHAPETFELIREADRMGAEDHGGHGPAVAQVFNHVIMPLANRRDKNTQILWGKKYFRRVYGREPEGMWLAETAADSETLGLLAQNGILFTILAQNQVDALRQLSAGGGRGAGPWIPCAGPPDPREPYRVFWGDGPRDWLDVFVYDGPVSRAVAFENLLRDGRAFLDRVMSAFGTPDGDRPLLVNLATDGESYGHHFHFGEMALAWLFDELLGRSGTEEDQVKLTNYGEYLASHPPRKEARLVENSSWSCTHGVERWRADCGCRTGGDPQWNQKWRAPLREGLDWLRDRIAEAFDRTAPEYLKDPWAARDGYGDVVASNYDPSVRRAFLYEHGTAAAGAPEGATTALALMECQLMCLYMFTSCAWFFDDIAGLEPVQNLRYAARAIELAQNWTPVDLTAGLLGHLARAVPNNTAYADGAELWNQEIAGSYLTAATACAQWAASAAMNEPAAFHGQRWVEVSALESERVVRDPADPLPVLYLARASLRETRLDARAERLAMVLADDGPRLDILVFETGPNQAPDFERAKSVFIDKGAQYLRSSFAALFPGEAQFTLESLWPQVRDRILAGQLKEFFDEIRHNTVRAFHNHRDALLKYSRKGSAWDWMDKFVFRLMAEVDLENVLKPMRDGRPVDLDRLTILLDQDTGASSRNMPVVRESAGLYIRSLFSQLERGPRRPTLPEELLGFLNFVKSNMPDLDLWEFQNLYHHLMRHEADLFRSLAQSEGDMLAEIGRTLGFSEHLTRPPVP